MAPDRVEPDHPHPPELLITPGFRDDVQRVFRPGWLPGTVADPEMRAQFLARPAATWADFGARLGFLFDRFGLTPEGQDRRMQRLIQRARSDLARLIQREARKR